MKTFTVLASALALGITQAFTTGTLPETRSSQLVSYGYVPSGFTPEEYKKFKEAEAKKKAKQNLGGLGPRGFKSRSFQSFQEALERGETTHLMPVFNAKDKVKRGELKVEDIPYMQRGGSWDNSDVKGARKMKWLQSDKDYASGGYKKEQSVSIFGVGEGLDWTGSRARSRPESAPGLAPKFNKNYKAPNVKDLKKGGNSEPKKKFFGLF
mmetsp:Transcript_56824/g.164908  ORF Transcript_56824/g.164908 Transcript_56824/m.164908 type:complete len:210 (-) Transcript_56824:37-666(-)|eukprot:CAMPEP_0176053820 /NCGR_PEP_ID=MMETSP0120_2-20121206/26774_1 /TAXON_ID=160619 /ORGANISM="Kryptoperidinium foliaceum, Strain CCMP 1326" /LENGTH=209 /DNA_ID=CAMNT_0017387281 /DNA_START=51 /DNA_END=680 /DNA_ORIENTATION=-